MKEKRLETSVQTPITLFCSSLLDTNSKYSSFKGRWNSSLQPRNLWKATRSDKSTSWLLMLDLKRTTDDQQRLKVHINPTQFLAHRNDHEKLPGEIFYSFSLNHSLRKYGDSNAQFWPFEKKSRVCSLTPRRPGKPEWSSAKSRRYVPILAILWIGAWQSNFWSRCSCFFPW